MSSTAGAKGQRLVGDGGQPDQCSRQRCFGDTSLAAEEVLIGLYRQLPSWRKLELVEDANRTARQLAFCGLRARYPDDSIDRLRQRLIVLVLGVELAKKAYGPFEEDG